MFRTSCVHHQEDHLYMQLCGTFFMHLYKQSSTSFHLLDCLHNYKKHSTENCMYKWSSWWWTHDVRNMHTTPRIEL